MSSDISASSAMDHAHLAQSCEMAVLELLSKRRAIEYSISRREAVLRAVINSEQVDGKKRYTNNDARIAEFGRRSAEDSELLDMRSKYSEVVAEIGAAEIEAKFHARMIRIICAFAENYRAKPNTDDERNPWERS